MSPKFDYTSAGTKSTTESIAISGIMFTNKSNACLDNLPSFSGNKTLYAKIETIFGRHFTIKCLSHDMERKNNKNVASPFPSEPMCRRFGWRNRRKDSPCQKRSEESYQGNYNKTQGVSFFFSFSRSFPKYQFRWTSWLSRKDSS